ncbi:hypothetical protein [Nonlabens sp.]|uniref:hypothetical protein n=1 Tax=Nonlabens sp. TaxID=1888209 RepID=UPI001BD073BF|nr:hypothetical protein [Nonlabens sp.]
MRINCLAPSTYYTKRTDEADIIDPLRAAEQYLEMAKEKKAEINYIFETCFHAIFLSGHIGLAKKRAPQLFMVL